MRAPLDPDEAAACGLPPTLCQCEVTARVAARLAAGCIRLNATHARLVRGAHVPVEYDATEYHDDPAEVAGGSRVRWIHLAPWGHLWARIVLGLWDEDLDFGLRRPSEAWIRATLGRYADAEFRLAGEAVWRLEGDEAFRAYLAAPLHARAVADSRDLPTVLLTDAEIRAEGLARVRPRDARANLRVKP